jgi:hypothetical protein
MGVEAEQFFSGIENLLDLLRGRAGGVGLGFFLIADVLLHGGACALTELLEAGGERAAGTVEFAAHGVGGLVGQFGDFVVAQALVGHE